MSVFTNKIEESDDYQMPERISSENVVIIGPFRFVKPYPFIFTAGPKKRWVGEKLVDVFTKEFIQSPREVYVQRIKEGKITVNGKMIPLDYRIKELDSIRHVCQRKEAPIYNKELLKLGEVKDYVAYFKPSSISVNSVGCYFYNSMVKMLPSDLYVIHRLDRVTSGIIVFGKSKYAAQKFANFLSDDKVHKKYVARVIGVFPETEIIVDQPLDMDYDSGHVIITPTGKPSKTLFRRLQTNGVESVVECKPISGRTHQIRAHLQYLGFPITNDDKYGGKRTEFSKKEKEALKIAESQGLWPCDFCADKNDPYLQLQIYLCSIKYKTDEFSFRAPMPEWADLNRLDDDDDRAVVPEKRSKCRI